MRLSLGFDELKLDKGRYTRAVAAVLQEQVRLAVAAALKEMIDRVPFYTGTSRGALRAIGEVVGVAVPVSPIAYRKGQGPSIGQQQSHAEIDTTGLRVKFNFSTDVKQFIINELYADTNARGPSSPWGSLEAARRVFKEYMRANLKKNMPQLKKFITRTRVGG